MAGSNALCSTSSSAQKGGISSASKLHSLRMELLAQILANAGAAGLFARMVAG